MLSPRCVCLKNEKRINIGGPIKGKKSIRERKAIARQGCGITDVRRKPGFREGMVDKVT